MSENYIMLNGKRVDLTDEQIEKLGLKVKNKDYFARVDSKKRYYFINALGNLSCTYDYQSETDKYVYDVANYCTDKDLLQQRALHETLSRLLWRFSMQHDGDKIDWQDKHSYKYNIVYSYYSNKFQIHAWTVYKTQGVIFKTEKIAQRAIDEIILPFMKKHPEFVW